MSSRLDNPEFSGVKGRFAAWMLTSPFRRLLEWKMGKPDDRVMALLALQGNEHVVDAGCGSGFHSLMVAEQLPQGRVMAVDVSTEMLDRLRTSATARGLSERIELHHADGLSLPLPDGSMDRAVSAAVWHHLDDPQGAAIELARVLRPGGRLVVVDLEIGGGAEARGGRDPGDHAAHDHAAHDHGAHVHGAHQHGHGKHAVPFGAEDMRRILVQAGLVAVQVELIGRWVVGAGDKPS
jgi:SAM-dependent methyltransferase